ncbi:small subunit methyltransferase B [Seminavis robusta]|uniref:Small subunit methyltransferase B n=1 Tax=Seminavis robusta TaxID=568900 RepID=A0A9N8H399_9STRA|nr:small subunit methyltransferase B [Seminavis robusta]|eukprot:Sro83_g044310.1 small subunit methyltransferase B (551) ;mRNA; r:45486-47299
MRRTKELSVILLSLPLGLLPHLISSFDLHLINPLYRSRSFVPQSLHSTRSSDNDQKQRQDISSKSGKDSTENVRLVKNNKASPGVVNARYVAVMALLAASSSEAFSLRRLEQDQNYLQLEIRDRRFARMLVATVERRKGQIDKILKHCITSNTSKRTTPKQQNAMDAESMVYAALQIGVVQLIFLQTPPHAAVKETVDVLRMNRRIKVSKSKISLVNAVLRRVHREAQELDSITSPIDNIAPWLRQEWLESWGPEKLNAITEAAMTESPVYISVNNNNQETQDDMLQSTLEAFLQTAARNNRPVSHWPLYQEGHWWVQDAAATLPALALYNSLLDKKHKQEINSDSIAPNDMTVVDLCAAPGGKTAQLLSLGFPSVTAVEISSRRARQLQTNLERLGLKCQVDVADGTTWMPPQSSKKIAGVLLDAPCSATGTASRRPDVLRKSKRDVKQLLETQYRLATHCIDNLLEPGGILVYATCSLLKQESEDQVQKLLDNEEASCRVKTIPFQQGEIPGFDQAIDEHGHLRVIPGTLPGKLSTCDGFFVARLQKQ